MSDPSEQPRRRRRPSQPAAPPAAGSPARGVILVVVALAIGVFLLRDDDVASTQVAVGTDQTSQDTGADGEPEVDGDGAGGEEDPTTTTAALRPPAEVKVLVANGSGVNGAAGATTSALEALGYVTGSPANASRVDATQVLFTEGYQPEAEAVAEALGTPPTAVAAMPAVAPVDDLQLANVLVVVGPDVANAGA